MPFRGAASATSATLAATSSAAMGWNGTGGRNGDAFVSLRTTLIMTHVVATTSTGTGEKMMMLGNENHRAAILGCVNGVHTLTTTIAVTRTSVSGRASAFNRC